MAVVGYLVPYEVAVHATDLGSGRPITNILYYQSGQQGTPPAYGAPITGGGSTTTMLAAVRSAWNFVVAKLNVNYVTSAYVMRSMLGKRYSTPSIPIAGLVSGTPTTINTAAPHNLATNDQVFVQGVTVPSAANGNWRVTVTSPTQFDLDFSTTAGVWSLDGSFQKVAGALEVLYGDMETLTVADAGGIAGDALPLFVTASIRRLNPGVGRHFRSRFSLSPMSEADSLDGGFTAGQRAAMVTALASYNIGVVNGGSAASSDHSFPIAFTRAVALAQPSPWTSASLFTRYVSTMVQQRNTGSLVRRKPKLTSIIA